MKTAALLMLVSGLALLTGCQNENTVERASPRALPDNITEKQIVTDSTLAGGLRVVSVNQTTVSGNLLKVQAQLENLRNRSCSINYCFEWYDREGMLLATPGGSWNVLRLQGRESSAISAVAVSPKAVDFVLKLQEAK